MHQINSAFTLSDIGVLAWIALCITVSVTYRKSRGKPIYPCKPKDALYCESWASGHSKRDFLSMIGGARNCLMVAVTPSAFLVRPNFPFNLMFLPEIYDLEHDIPRKNICSVIPHDGVFGKGVRIELELESGDRRTIQLWLRHRDQLLHALAVP